MTSLLFSDRPRTDSSKRRLSESAFDFYDRVDTPFFAEVRTQLSRWFDRFPTAERPELRLRLYDAGQGEAALWELIVHELHRAAGYAVTVHPEIEGTTHRPDFLMTRGDNAFLVEARLVTATSDARRRRDRRLDTLIESINQRATPRAFYTQLVLVKEGVQQPPTAVLVRDLEAWLDEVDRTVPVEQLRAARSLRELPSREFAAADWKLRFVALPVAAEKRGRLKGPMVGVGPIETGGGVPGEQVRKALRRKGGRYGSVVPYPLVIALALEELTSHVEEDVASVLFGRTPRTSELQGGGYWSGRRGAGSRVSGVLTMDHPRPWMLPRLQPRLWLNPWATRPLSGPHMWATRTVDPDTGVFREMPPQVAMAELLGLAEGWPPGPPFPD